MKLTGFFDTLKTSVLGCLCNFARCIVIKTTFLRLLKSLILLSSKILIWCILIFQFATLSSNIHPIRFKQLKILNQPWINCCNNSPPLGINNLRINSSSNNSNSRISIHSFKLWKKKLVVKKKKQNSEEEKSYPILLLSLAWKNLKKENEQRSFFRRNSLFYTATFF